MAPNATNLRSLLISTNAASEKRPGSSRELRCSPAPSLASSYSSFSSSSFSTAASHSHSGRRISFHESLTTNVIEIPTVDETLKSSLFYTKEDYTEFYKEQREEMMGDIHALVRDIMSDQLDEAIANGATQEELEAMIPKTPEQIRKVIEMAQRGDKPSLLPDQKPHNLSPVDVHETDDDSDSDDESDDDFEHLKKSQSDDDDDDLYDWEQAGNETNDTPKVRRHSVDSSEGFEDDLEDVVYDWGDDKDDKCSSDDNCVDKNQAKEDSPSSRREQQQKKALNLSDSSIDLSDDDIYALFGLGDANEPLKRRQSSPPTFNCSRGSGNDSVSSTTKLTDSFDSLQDFSDDDIYALFGLGNGSASFKSPLKSPSRRGYRRAVNMYSPAPREQRKRRVSQLPRVPKLDGTKKQSFAALLSRSKTV